MQARCWSLPSNQERDRQRWRRLPAGEFDRKLEAYATEFPHNGRYGCSAYRGQLG